MAGAVSIFLPIWLPPEGGDQGLSSTCIYFTASKSVAPPPLMIVSLGKEKDVIPRANGKSESREGEVLCPRSHRELKAYKPLPHV